MNLYVIRHGETGWNKNDLFQGRSDIPLNETGIAQAKAAAEKYKDVHFDVCITSPLVRCKETARIFLGERRIEVLESPLLVERNCGKLEGTTVAPDIEKLFWTIKSDMSAYQCEPMPELFDRAKRALAMVEKLHQEQGYENILLCTHGGFSRILHFVIEGYDENTDLMSYWLHNCELDHYEL